MPPVSRWQIWIWRPLRMWVAKWARWAAHEGVPSAFFRSARPKSGHLIKYHLPGDKTIFCQRFARWWFHFFYFHPENWGNDPGWFNHQLVWFQNLLKILLLHSLSHIVSASKLLAAIYVRHSPQKA